MKIVMIGAGYVGLVSGVCFSDFGHQVICVEKDQEKLTKLQAGAVPIFEPGLDLLLERNINEGRLAFSNDLEKSIIDADAVFIAVPPDTARDIAKDCLSRKFNIFKEKPLGISLNQTEELTKVSRSNKCISMVGFNRRYAPVLRRSRQLVEEHVGITLFVSEFHKFHLRDAPYLGSTSWLLVDIINHLDTLY